MYIRITRATVCDGTPVNAGDVIEATYRSAMTLIQMNKAVLVEEVETAIAEPAETAMVKPITKKRGRRAKK